MPRMTAPRLAAIGLILASLTGGVWIVVSLSAAAQAASQARADAQRVVAAGQALDEAALLAAVDALADSAAALEGVAASAPLSLLGWVPVVGASVEAVQVLGSSIDDLAQSASPLVAVIDDDDSGGGGRTSVVGQVMALLDAQPQLEALASSAGRAYARLAPFADRALLSPVGTQVRDALAAVTTLRGGLDAAVKTGPPLRSMLGADGSRTWLVMSQNPAELRGSGGLFNAYLLLRVEEGHIEIVEAGSRKMLDHEFARAEQIPYEDALAGEPATDWGPVLGEWASFNIPVDFPTVGRLAAAGMAKRDSPVDGVIAIDPAVVQAALAGTGPVEHKGVTIDSTNASDFFTSGIYADHPGFDDVEEKDALAMGLTYAALDALLKRPLDVVALWRSMSAVVSGRHIAAWSSVEAEQAWLAESTLGGALVQQADEVVVGWTNTTGGKLDRYLTRSVTTDASQCATDGTVTTTIAMANDAPEDLPTYVDVVLDANGVPDPWQPSGRTNTYVAVYPPKGWQLASARLDGAAFEPWTGVEAGRSLWIAPVLLDRGQTTTVELVFTAPACPASPG